MWYTKTKVYSLTSTKLIKSYLGVSIICTELKIQSTLLVLHPIQFVKNKN